MTFTETARARLALLGRPVFPLHSLRADGGCTCGKPDCRDAGKHPRTAHGLKDARDTDKAIEAWGKRWPTARVGISMGEMCFGTPCIGGGCFGEYLLVIDEDSYKGWDLAGWHLPATLTARTGHGGRHHYFCYSGEPLPTVGEGVLALDAG